MCTAPIAGPMDLRPPITATQLAAQLLPVIGRRHQPLEELVVLYGLRRTAGELVGFGVSFGWDLEDDRIRELDFALPGLGKAHPTLAFEALARLAAAGFVHERAVELRTCLRGGAGGRGAERVFAAIGARECRLPAAFESLRDRTAGRVVYSLTPNDFARSPAARRWGLSATPGAP
jgi:hypothetical protein